MKIYRGKNCGEKFVAALDNEYNQRSRRLNTITPLIMRPKDETIFKQATVCSICLKQIDQKETKVMDHDHISGAFRGAAHSDCNINAILHKKMIVYMHNAKR